MGTQNWRDRNQDVSFITGKGYIYWHGFCALPMGLLKPSKLNFLQNNIPPLTYEDCPTPTGA